MFSLFGSLSGSPGMFFWFFLTLGRRGWFCSLQSAWADSGFEKLTMQNSAVVKKNPTYLGLMNWGRWMHPCPSQWVHLDRCWHSRLHSSWPAVGRPCPPSALGRPPPRKLVSSNTHSEKIETTLGPWHRTSARIWGFRPHIYVSTFHAAYQCCFPPTPSVMVW